MSDNLIDNSYDIDALIEHIKEMKDKMEDMETTLQEVRDNTSLLSDIKDYLYELKNK
jgi:hypothetical protein